MDSSRLEKYQATLKAKGAQAAIDQLCQELKDEKDYQALFYALLMKRRHALGASPIATGNNADLPASDLDAFEDGIREACRTVGQLYLDDDQLPQAWGYFRMIGEMGPVAKKLEAMGEPPEENSQPYIDIAFHQGVLPKTGFDWLLKRYGMCSAITTVSAGEMPFSPEVKSHCVRTLVKALHAELLDRLRAEIKQKQGFAPTATTIKELIEGRDWLFADDYYHIDLSHLNSVIQMAGQLDPGDEMRLARDLCAYGQKLSPRFNYQTDPPFENLYVDYDQFLGVLLGDDADKRLDHFRKKAADADPETIGTYPAEVLVNLLIKIGRPLEALEVSRTYLAKSPDARYSCPSFVELCQQTGSFEALAEVSREQGHTINFLAALIAGSK